MPMLVAPIAGILSDRIGSRPLLVAGMALMATALGWMAAICSPTVPYADLVPAFVMAGVGMSLYFAPVANLVLSSVRRDEEGKASGVEQHRCARSAACSASPCWPACSRRPAATSRRHRS